VNFLLKLIVLLQKLAKKRDIKTENKSGDDKKIKKLFPFSQKKKKSKK